MSSNNPSSFKKLMLTGVISAIIGLTGCNGDDGKDGATGADGAAGAPGQDASSGIATTSGYLIPTDAIFIAEDATDGDDITDAINLAIVNALLDGIEDPTLVLPQGEFVVSDTITVSNADGLTLTGYGINETKLDFTSSTTADDAIRFEGGTDITIRDFGVYEANKNGIKLTNANGVHIAYTATVWEGALEADNGAYGVYPLNSTNVLIENNYSRGSADAGIYVGQSKDIVVRRNVAKENVAGIEIENSFNADVYDNIAVGNTGGILVFDLPNLDQAFGGNVRVFDNFVYANNADNFAGGGAVSIVPPGTGMLIFATSNVEIYNNELIDNETSSIEIASYFLDDADVPNYGTNYGSTMAAGWSPLIKNVYMHDNTIQRSGANPRGDLITDIVNGYTLGLGQTMPAILYGGVGESLSNASQLTPFDAIVSADALTLAAENGVDLSYDGYGASELICANNNFDANSNADSADFTDVNIGQVYTADPTTPALAFDTVHGNDTLLNCIQPRLTANQVVFKGKVYGCNGDDLASRSCSL